MFPTPNKVDTVLPTNNEAQIELNQPALPDDDASTLSQVTPNHHQDCCPQLLLVGLNHLRQAIQTAGLQLTAFFQQNNTDLNENNLQQNPVNEPTPNVRDNTAFDLRTNSSEQTNSDKSQLEITTRQEINTTNPNTPHNEHTQEQRSRIREAIIACHPDMEATPERLERAITLLITVWNEENPDIRSGAVSSTPDQYAISEAIAGALVDELFEEMFPTNPPSQDLRDFIMYDLTDFIEYESTPDGISEADLKVQVKRLACQFGAQSIDRHWRVLFGETEYIKPSIYKKNILPNLDVETLCKTVSDTTSFRASIIALDGSIKQALTTQLTTAFPELTSSSEPPHPLLKPSCQALYNQLMQSRSPRNAASQIERIQSAGTELLTLAVTTARLGEHTADNHTFPKYSPQNQITQAITYALLYSGQNPITIEPSSLQQLVRETVFTTINTLAQEHNRLCLEVDHIKPTDLQAFKDGLQDASLDELLGTAKSQDNFLSALNRSILHKKIQQSNLGLTAEEKTELFDLICDTRSTEIFIIIREGYFESELTRSVAKYMLQKAIKPLRPARSPEEIKTITHMLYERLTARNQLTVNDIRQMPSDELETSIRSVQLSLALTQNHIDLSHQQTGTVIAELVMNYADAVDFDNLVSDHGRFETLLRSLLLGDQDDQQLRLQEKIRLLGFGLTPLRVERAVEQLTQYSSEWAIEALIQELDRLYAHVDHLIVDGQLGNPNRQVVPLQIPASSTNDEARLEEFNLISEQLALSPGATLKIEYVIGQARQQTLVTADEGGPSRQAFFEAITQIARLTKAVSTTDEGTIELKDNIHPKGSQAGIDQNIEAIKIGRLIAKGAELHFEKVVPSYLQPISPRLMAVTDAFRFGTNHSPFELNGFAAKLYHYCLGTCTK